MVRSLVLVSGFSHESDPRMNLQFKLWLRLASTDKVAFTKLPLVSGLSPGFCLHLTNPTGSLKTLSHRLTGARSSRPSGLTLVWMCGSTPLESRPPTCRLLQSTIRSCRQLTRRIWFLTRRPLNSIRPLDLSGKASRAGFRHTFFLPKAIRSRLMKSHLVRVRDHSEKPDEAVPAVICKC